MLLAGRLAAARFFGKHGQRHTVWSTSQNGSPLFDPVIRACFLFRWSLLDFPLKMFSFSASSSSSFLSPSVFQSPSESLPLCVTTLPLLARQELPASLRTPQNPFHYRRRQEPPVSLRIPQNPSDCLPVWRRQRNIIVTFALSNVSSSKTRRRIDKQSPELCSVFVVVGVLLTTEFAIVFVVVGFC